MKYYICEQCGELTTSDQIEDECSNGGSGNCSCQYMQYIWDSKQQGFEPIYFKEYPEWTEIPGMIFSDLLKELNTMKRLWMLASIPKEELKV
jgi:hypothetical protein